MATYVIADWTIFFGALWVVTLTFIVLVMALSIHDYKEELARFTRKVNVLEDAYVGGNIEEPEEVNSLVDLGTDEFLARLHGQYKARQPGDVEREFYAAQELEPIIARLHAIGSGDEEPEIIGSEFLPTDGYYTLPSESGIAVIDPIDLDHGSDHGDADSIRWLYPSNTDYCGPRHERGTECDDWTQDKSGTASTEKDDE
jgi:hypothetical protein